MSYHILLNDYTIFAIVAMMCIASKADTNLSEVFSSLLNLSQFPNTGTSFVGILYRYQVLICINYFF